MTLALPPGAAGQWCCVRVWAKAAGPWWVKLELEDASRGQVVRQAFLGEVRGGPFKGRAGRASRQTLVHVTFDSERLTLTLFGENAKIARVSTVVLGRRRAAWLLLLHGWRLLPRAMRGQSPGLAGRIRALLGQAPARAGQAPPYATWIDLYDRITPAERGHLAASLARRIPATLQIAVACPPGREAGLRATRHAIERQSPAPTLPTQIIRTSGDWLALTADWVGIIGPGEVLAELALARAADAIAAGEADFLYGDTDDLDAHGRRCDPCFKPRPGPVLLPSGWLTTGLCLVRRAAVPWGSLPADADAARLLCATALAARPDHDWATMRRLPHILTHRSGPSRDRPPPIRIAKRPAARRPVTIIVPTAARAPHVLRCLRRVALATDYPDFEIILAVSAIDPGCRRQASLLRALARLPRLRVLDLEMPAFNYAEANNRAAAHATGDSLLLLNDDVAPIDPGWLGRMAALQDRGAGIVGARLLYGNDTVQHGGVILGLADLCEHDSKFRDAADPGPSGLAALDRDISAVTAACMLVSTGLYRDLGGLDTAFAIALNDVDFCLRARARGAGIALCAGATLHHYESLSLGRHYEGARAPLEGREVLALRERWADAIGDDPFYNPQASLEPGREWCPAFPPRLRVV